MTRTPLSEINEFLSNRRLAVVGVSHDAKDFSRSLFNELKKYNYDVVPVNPNLSEVEGQPCYAHVQDITPPVGGVVIMTPPQITDQIVQDCAEAGIHQVWMHRGGGVGAVSENAIEYCQQHDIKVVAGYCPYMFLPQTSFFHGLHGFGLKLVGKYPA